MSTVNVLVLEYGPVDRSNVTLIPYYGTELNFPAMFDLASAPEPFMEGAVAPVFIGAVAGGGTTVNGLTYNIASAADYDSWEQLGNEGWGWDGIQTYLRKVSNRSTMPWPMLTSVGHRVYLTSRRIRGTLQLLRRPFRVWRWSLEDNAANLATS